VTIVDPTGKFGDYYTREGYWLGSDGVDDDKAFLTTFEVWMDNHKFSYRENQRNSHHDFDLLTILYDAISKDHRTIFLGSNKNLESIAATAFGESSTDNVIEEMAGIASVIVRKEREGVRVGALAKTDGNIRFNQFQNSQPRDRNEEMTMAVRAAINALTNGPDYSGGAYYWDGKDFAANKKIRVRRQGFIYGHEKHNIFGVPEVRLTTPVVRYWIKASGKRGTVRGVYDHVYVSTAVQGWTIFWRYGEDFMKADGIEQGD